MLAHLGIDGQQMRRTFVEHGGPRGREVEEERAVEDLLEEIGAVAMAAQMAEAEGLDPRSLAEAKRRLEWPRWEEAMEEELHALEAHKTWRLKRPPPNANVVSCRWVFHAKKDASGNVYRYRARLVARGFSQVPGVARTSSSLALRTHEQGRTLPLLHAVARDGRQSAGPA